MDKAIIEGLAQYYDFKSDHDLEQKLNTAGWRITSELVSTKLRDVYNFGEFSGRTDEEVYSSELGIDCSKYRK